MDIEQHKFGHHHRYTLQKNAVHFRYRDRHGTGELTAWYSALPVQTSTQFVEPSWLRSIGLLWCLFGLVEMARAWMSGRPLTGTGFYVAVGLLCLIANRLARVTFTVLGTGAGDLRVIQDGRTHDELLEELARRRKQQIKSLHDHLNANRSLEQELAHFAWLRDEGVLDTEEFAERVEQVRQAICQPSEATERQ